jgi:DNA-binding CsgD family transcriptional regulator
VGRAGELGRLRELVVDADCPGVVVAAPAGMGKTRLALEGLAVAERAGLATARVVATRAAATLPFGALAPLLAPHRPAEPGRAGDRAELLRRSAAALAERAGERRLVLLVDDAHNLDDLSATVIHQLALTNAVFVLATVRAGEPAPDPVVGLWKDGLVERIELGGLAAEAVEELLGVVLAGPVDRAAATVLAVRCQGNVLFLRELVVGALADRSLRDDGGIWRLVGPLSPSDRLVELVEARLGRLETAEHALLELVSFGEPLGPAELTALSDVSMAEHLERQGLLASVVDRRRLQIRLAHPLYGDVVRARIPAVRVREIARRLAEAVEATGARRREDILRVATWRLSGGGARPGTMLAAATIARWRYDFPLAERLAREAIDAGAGFDARLLAARLASLQGRGAQAEAELGQLATQATDDAKLGALTLARLDNATFDIADIADVWRAAEEAEAAITDPGWQNEIAARRSWMLLLTEGPRAAANLAEPLLWRTTGRAFVWTCMAAAESLRRLGRIDASLDAADRGYQASLALVEPLDWYSWNFLWYRCLSLANAGHFKQADALAASQYGQALTDRSPEAQGYFAWYVTYTVGEHGHVRTAAQHGREAVALFRQLNRPMLVRAGLLHLALALALAGSASDAASALAQHDSYGRADPAWSVDLLQARAWTAAAGGDLPEAARLLDQAATLGEKTGQLVSAAAAAHGLARLGHPKQAASRLGPLTEQIDGDLVAARLAHTESLARRDPAGLGDASEAFETMGADLLAAEAAADAAVAWRQAADPRRSLAAEHRAATLGQRCQGAATPALQAIGARARLTPAEREAALLAAAGHSNREIADQLYLSVRTVESRLQHVYEKLGISGRAQLQQNLSIND